MLKSLSITNLAVIESAVIDFEEGLSILTGETGAGKSIIIDAINLILGCRVSRDIIRTGSNKARAEALFIVDGAVIDYLEKIGVDCDGELLLSREITSDGRNNIRINGSLSTTAILRELGELLVNIHGQHDNRALLDPAKHLEILDEYGSLSKAKEEYKTAYEKVKELSGALKKLTGDVQERNKRIDILKHEIKMLEDADIKPGEYEELIKLKEIMDNSRRISSAVNDASRIISEPLRDKSVLEYIGIALKTLDDIKECSPALSAVYESLSQIYYSLEDVSTELSGMNDEFDFDEEKINETENRIDELNGIRRRFGTTYEEINDYYLKISEELDFLTNIEESTDKLEKELLSAKTVLKKCGEELSVQRRKAAETLDASIIKELSELNMPGAKFKTDIQRTEKYTREGIDKVEFLISVNSGIEPGKLSKIASGGELSRVMLGISSALLDKYSIPTVIYDEIDTGVSGRAAQKIAEKLWRVSEDRQVLAVTHLPQIAAMADNHYLIEKSSDGAVTKTSVKMLEYRERITEIARITGGVSINEATLKSAEDMLEQSRRLKGI